MGATAKLKNPQAGLAFDLQGPDSRALELPRPPALPATIYRGNSDWDLIGPYISQFLLRLSGFSVTKFDGTKVTV